jgi:hypothetical protein
MKRVSAILQAALTFGCCLTLTACGGSTESPATERTPDPAPNVTLTSNEKEVWAPLPPDRTEIPVLLYHGIGPERDFTNADDAAYGVDSADFARQLTMIKHAGYQTIDLATFRRFVNGESVDLPPRPLLLTFDDARADSWTGADGILKKLGFNAVMFVDVGRVDDSNPEYLTWKELQTMQSSGRWQLQLHSGHGHVYIQWGPDSQDTGPYYAYKEEGESFDGWKERTFSDITWGQQQLASHIPAYQPLAFAPPYGSYGQDGTNDSRIPNTLLSWLKQRYGFVFTEDASPFAQPGSPQPLGRIQVTRAVSGGDLHAMLVPPP